MQNQTIKGKMACFASQDEQILVVRRDLLLGNPWQGLQQQGIEECVKLIEKAGEFHCRADMETDPTFKQIIPYLVFAFQDRYFLMQRKSSASEQRLKNKMSLGIGGHMRQEDMKGTSLFDWARREFHEEVDYQGSMSIKPFGMLNDDSDSVGQVHFGLVLLVHGDASSITIKSELKQGQLLSLAECALYYGAMESWSRLVFDALQK